MILSRAAPTKTSINVFSDYRDAELATPLDDGVRTDIVNPGDQTKTFNINTRADDVDKGRHVTADITAFYAEPTTTTLRIVHRYVQAAPFAAPPVLPDVIACSSSWPSHGT